MACGSDYLPINWKRMIGKGTYGTIYESSRNKHYVTKVSTDSYTCHNYSNEFSRHHDAFDAWDQYMNTIGDVNPIFIPFPSGMGYSSNKQCCYYEMERLYDPFHTSCQKVVQVLLGCDLPYHYNCDNTGQHMGPYTLKLHLERTLLKLEDLARGIGQLYAIIQYGSQQTAYDVEMVLCEVNQNLCVATIDFDKSAKIEHYDPKILAKSLMSAHFPVSRAEPDLNPLYYIAKNSYIRTAMTYQCKDIADKVIEMYELFNPLY